MRFRAILSLCAIVAGIVSTSAFTVDGLNYSATDPVLHTPADYVILTGPTSTAISSVTIPASVTYQGITYPVQYVKHHAFSNCSKLTEVIVEDSELYLGSDVQRAIGTLTTISKADAISYAGSPFEGCPIKKYYLGRQNFRGTTSTVYEDYMVLSSTADAVELIIAGKTKTVIPEALVPTTRTVFDFNLTNLTIGGAVTAIGRDAFSGRTSLKKVTFETDNSSLTYGNGCFQNVALDSLIIKSDIKSLPFTSVNNVLIKNNVSKLTGKIFQNGLTISNVIFEDGDQQLKVDGALAQNNLDSLYVGRLVENFLSITSSSKGKLSCKHVTFGPAYTEIPESAFSSHTELESVTFPETLTKIGSSAFSGCTGLKSVDLPNGLKELGSSSFSGCSGLASIDLPNGIEILDGYCLQNTGITQISVPGSVVYVSGYALSSPSLKRVIIEDGDQLLKIAPPAFAKNKLDSLYVGRIVEHFIPISAYGDLSCKHVTFGPAYTEIPESAFQSHAELESVTFPETLTKIGGQAFRGCTGLKNANLPKGLKELGSYSFYECGGLTSIDLPNGIEILEGACLQNTGITQITVPASVVSVGGGALSSASLKKVVIEDGDQLLKMGSALYHNNLDSLYMGRLVENFGMFTHPNYDKLKCKHVAFGPAYAEIPQSAFEYCAELESVTFPETLTKIGSQAFSGCTGLTKITCFAKEPPTLTDNVFATAIYPTATLTVPSGSKQKYAKADVWKNFSNIASMAQGIKVTTTYNPEEGNVTLNGQSVNEIVVDEDEPLIVVITPLEGYEITSVTINGEESIERFVNGVAEFVDIDEDMEIVVTFGLLSFEVSAVSTEGGSILINGEGIDSLTVDYGSNLTLTVHADQDYTLKSLTINGLDVTAEIVDSAYHIQSIIEDIKIEACFEQITLNATVQCDSNIRVWVKDHSIIVEGADDSETISVFDTSGMMHYCGNETCINMNSNSIFIVTIAGRSHKVVVQ